MRSVAEAPVSLISARVGATGGTVSRTKLAVAAGEALWPLAVAVAETAIWPSPSAVRSAAVNTTACAAPVPVTALVTVWLPLVKLTVTLAPLTALTVTAPPAAVAAAAEATELTPAPSATTGAAVAVGVVGVVGAGVEEDFEPLPAAAAAPPTTASPPRIQPAAPRPPELAAAAAPDASGAAAKADPASASVDRGTTPCGMVLDAPCSASTMRSSTACSPSPSDRIRSSPVRFARWGTMVLPVALSTNSTCTPLGSFRLSAPRLRLTFLTLPVARFSIRTTSDIEITLKLEAKIFIKPVRGSVILKKCRIVAAVFNYNL